MQMELDPQIGRLAQEIVNACEPYLGRDGLGYRLGESDELISMDASPEMILEVGREVKLIVIVDADEFRGRDYVHTNDQYCFLRSGRVERSLGTFNRRVGEMEVLRPDVLEEPKVNPDDLSNLLVKILKSRPYRVPTPIKPMKNEGVVRYAAGAWNTNPRHSSYLSN